MLGIPNYSKLEAVLLFLGAVGAFLCWSSEVRSIFYHNLLLIYLPFCPLAYHQFCCHSRATCGHGVHGDLLLLRHQRQAAPGPLCHTPHLQPRPPHMALCQLPPSKLHHHCRCLRRCRAPPLPPAHEEQEGRVEDKVVKLKKVQKFEAQPRR